MSKKISEIIREEILNYKNIITESGYSRVANILRGFVPNINTIGILTAENPYGKQAPAEYNKKANMALENELKDMNLGFHNVWGKYGNVENSFLVPNITKDEALNLGKKYEQESIIFAERIIDDSNGNIGMKFQMIFTDHRFPQIDAERSVFIKKDNANDYYSKVKGRKFQIPFFDDQFEKASFEPNKGVIQKTPQTESLNLNNVVDKILNENTTPTSRWKNRGYINNTLKNIKLF